MTSLSRITGIHFFSTIVALLCLHKMVGLWKGSPTSLQQSEKCPDERDSENKCHENNLQFTGDRPHGNIRSSQVSQALPKDLFSGFSPVSAKTKNVLFCFQRCHPSRQRMGKFLRLRSPYKSLCWVLLLDWDYWWSCEELNSSPSSASSHKLYAFHKEDIKVN